MQGPRKHAGDAIQLQLGRHNEKRAMSKGHMGYSGHPIPASAARQAPRRWYQKHAASQSLRSLLQTLNQYRQQVPWQSSWLGLGHLAGSSCACATSQWTPALR